jgi:hypothetical protein
MKTKLHHSPIDRVNAARDERNERERCVTKRAIAASGSSSIGHGSTAGARPTRANSGSSKTPPTAPLTACAGPSQQPRRLIGPPKRDHTRAALPGI